MKKKSKAILVGRNIGVNSIEQTLISLDMQDKTEEMKATDNIEIDVDKHPFDKFINGNKKKKRRY